MSRINDLILCECHSDEHQMIFKYDSEPEWENVFISYYLQNPTFWDRVKYLFGYQSRYGAFGELILEPNDDTIEKFENVVKHLKLVQEYQEAERKRIANKL